MLATASAGVAGAAGAVVVVAGCAVVVGVVFELVVLAVVVAGGPAAPRSCSVETIAIAPAASAATATAAINAPRLSRRRACVPATPGGGRVHRSSIEEASARASDAP